MGMYDTVLVPCPKCGTKEAFQSRGGDCVLAEYELWQCPLDVLSDVTRHSPHRCENCGEMFTVRLTWGAEPVVVLEKA